MRNPMSLLVVPVLLLAAGPVFSQDREADHRIPSVTQLQLPLDMPAYRDPATVWRTVEDGIPDEVCRDRIRKARQQAGLPEAETESANPDEPLLIWAVDRRVNGCGVLVAKGNLEDVRPIPQTRERAELIPAQ